MSDYNELQAQIHRLLVGLADQHTLEGKQFFYDGGELFPDDVADMCKVSILALSQDLAERVGMKSFGFQFKLGDPSPVFPLEMQAGETCPSFFEIAPFITEVFDGEVVECRKDIAVLFQLAARVVQPDYALTKNTTYQVKDGGQELPLSSSQPAQSSPGLNR